MTTTTNVLRKRVRGEMGDKSSETVVLCYTNIIRRERECELWIVLARRKGGDREGTITGTIHGQNDKHKGGNMDQKRG